MVSFREVKIEDAEQVAELITQLGYQTDKIQMTDRLQNLIHKSDRATIVAEVDGAVTGIIGMNISPYYEKDGLYGRIVVLVVNERHRGKNIGKNLLNQAEQWFRKNEASDVVVNSGVQRMDTHRFYEKFGYEKTGFRFVKKIIAK